MAAKMTMAMLNMILMPILILRPCSFAFNPSTIKSTIDNKTYSPTTANKKVPIAENIGPNTSRDNKMNLLQANNLSPAIVITSIVVQ